MVDCSRPLSLLLIATIEILLLRLEMSSKDAQCVLIFTQIWISSPVKFHVTSTKQEQMAEISILSRQLVQPSTSENETERKEIIHLSTWDLAYLCFDYMQIGLLFSKPYEPVDQTISSLKISFSQTLGYFYPFAGRLSTTSYDDGTLSICIACNDQGAEFVHASALDVAVSDILTNDYYLPEIVHSLFPIQDVVGHDGHTLPLLAVQITELVDGIFIACSLNHVASDGTSLWQFIQTWSKVTRNIQTVMDRPLIFDRFFLHSYPPPIRIPYKNPEDFVKRPNVDRANRAQCFLQFSSDTVKRLKATANDEMGYEKGEISSLQALSAHVWIAISQARRLPNEQVTANVVVVGYRSRFPKAQPIPQTYLGNAVGIAIAIYSAGEITEKGIGWVASKLKAEIAKMEDEVIINQVHSWVKEPSFPSIGNDNGFFVVTTGGQRFDVYGNDFGWGSPLAIRKGGWNKVEGRFAVYPGKDEGSIDLDIFLAADTMKALLENREFMATVG